MKHLVISQISALVWNNFKRKWKTPAEVVLELVFLSAIVGFIGWLIPQFPHFRRDTMYVPLEAAHCYNQHEIVGEMFKAVEFQNVRIGIITENIEETTLQNLESHLLLSLCSVFSDPLQATSCIYLLNVSTPLFVHFETHHQLKQHIQHKEYGTSTYPTLFLALQFSSITSEDFSYTILFDDRPLYLDNRVFYSYSMLDFVVMRQFQSVFQCSGFYLIQHAVNSFGASLSNVTLAQSFQLNAQPMPMEYGIYGGFMSNDVVRQLLPILICLLYLLNLVSLLRFISTPQREGQIEWLQCTANVSPYVWNIADGLFYFGLFGIQSLIASLCFQFVFLHISFLVLFFGLWLFTCSFYPLAILLIKICGPSLSSIISATIFFIFAVLLGDIGMEEMGKIHYHTQLQISSLLSPTAFIYFLRVLTQAEAYGERATLLTIQKPSLNSLALQLSIQDTYMFLLTDVLVYYGVIFLFYLLFEKDWKCIGKRFEGILHQSFGTVPLLSPPSVDKSDESLVQFSGVRLEFGKVTALEEIWFQAPEHSTICFIGETSAGKTSLLNVVTGRVKPSQGQVCVLGNHIPQEIDKLRSNLGYCPQSLCLFSHLNMDEHFELFNRLGCTALKHEQIEELDLNRYRDTTVDNLSAGKRRMLAVALAFSGNPQVIVLDEPSTSLDPMARRQVRQLIKRLGHKKTVMLSTHSMVEAEVLASHIAVMSHGLIRCFGSPQSLRARYGVGYSLTLRHNPETETQTEEIYSYLPSEATKLRDLTLRQDQVYHIPLADDNSAQNVERLLMYLETKSIDYEIELANLEHVFLLAHEQDSRHSTPSLNEAPLVTLPTTIRKSNQFKAILWKRLQISCSSISYWIVRFLVPCLVLAIVTVLVQQASNSINGKNEPPVLMDYDYLYENHPITLDLATSSASCPLYPTLSSSAGAIDYISTNASSVDDVYDALLSRKDPITNMLYVGALYSAPSEYNDHTCRYRVLYNLSFPYALPLLMHTFDISLFNTLLSSKETPPQITSTLTRLPQTRNELRTLDAHLSVLWIICVVSTLSLTPSYAAAFIAKEIHSKVKFHQQLTGVSSWLYWSTHFLVDLFECSLPSIAAFGIIYSMQWGAFQGDQYQSIALAALLSAHWISTLLFSYVFAHFFSSPSLTFYLSVSFHTLTSGILLLGIIVLLGTVASLIPLLRALDPFFCLIFPSYSLARGLAYLTFYYSDIFDANQYPISPQSGSNVDTFDYLVTGMCLQGLAINCGICLIMLVLFSSRECFLRRFRQRTTSPLSSDYAIQIDRLNKRFRNWWNWTATSAVENVSFNVPSQTCLGLLGFNSSGKSTTLKCIVGEYIPTSGSISLNGENGTHAAVGNSNRIGYCPQYDPLYDQLSPRQHLMLYASLRGVSGKDTTCLVDYFLLSLALEPFADRPCVSLSGGTRRRLVVGLCLIGNQAQVLLLDEPSAGVDPISQRLLWYLVRQAACNKSVLLTTHDLREAKALVTDVIIMKQGQIAAQGSVWSLEDEAHSSFERKYALHILFRCSSSCQRFQQFINAKFQWNALAQTHQCYLDYSFPLSNDYSLTEVFVCLHSSVLSYNIISFTLSPLSLDHTFSHLHSSQEADV